MSNKVHLQISPEPDAPPPELCGKLRTKMAFGSLSGTRDWRHGDSTTAVYWCLRTMETWGTDERLAHPHACVRGRSCFAPPPGAEDIA